MSDQVRYSPRTDEAALGGGPLVLVTCECGAQTLLPESALQAGTVTSVCGDCHGRMTAVKGAA